jgi:hypothetical protein
MEAALESEETQGGVDAAPVAPPAEPGPILPPQNISAQNVFQRLGPQWLRQYVYDHSDEEVQRVEAALAAFTALEEQLKAKVSVLQVARPR